MVDVREEIKKMEAEGSAETKGFMDIRFFIGLILTVYGIILTIYGTLTNTPPPVDIGINLNLCWGIVILIVGLLFFIPSKKPHQWGK
ncbi:MAG: hypothetical protein M1536_07550 [Firmicutes bacterium]|nr:hypothetical protein [Bacillota bacterium]